MPTSSRCGITCVQVRQPPFALVTRISPNCNPVSLSKCCGLGKYLSATGGEFRVISAILDLAIGRRRAMRRKCEESFDRSRRSAWRGRSRAAADANLPFKFVGHVPIGSRVAVKLCRWRYPMLEQEFGRIGPKTFARSLAGYRYPLCQGVRSSPVGESCDWGNTPLEQRVKQRRRNAVNVGGRLRRRFLR
jgi:hypothetical protein